MMPRILIGCMVFFLAAFVHADSAPDIDAQRQNYVAALAARGTVEGVTIGEGG